MRVLALDIDGVLVPSGKIGTDDQLVKVHADYQGSYNFSLPLARAINKLPCSKVWLTTWEDQANEAFAGLFGQLPVIRQSPRDKGRWWKVLALLRWFDAQQARPQKFVWAEDESYLHPEDMAYLEAELAQRGCRFKLIETHLIHGLQPKHLDEIRDFLLDQ